MYTRAMVGDADLTCIVCGQKLAEIVRDESGRIVGLKQNHRCCPKYIKNIEATRAAVDERQSRTPSYVERLNLGCFILALNQEPDENVD